MSHSPYLPQYRSGRVSVSHDVVAGSGALRPLTCRWPSDEAPKALVVFCHGLGASGRGYTELSDYWAAHGYFVVHPTFPDWIGAVAATEPGLGLDPNAPDLSGWSAIPEVRTRMHEILHTPSAWMERIRIVREVMEELDGIFAATCGRPVRPIQAAIAGHSFGAYTSQLFAGAEIDLPGQPARRFRDDRFAAALLLSAQGRDQQGLREGSWDGMSGPVLNVTGTLDRGARGQDWKWKSEPYTLAPAGEKYLAVFDNADHYLGGITTVDPGAGIPEQRSAVCQLTLAFLDAHVMKDGSARSWLAAISDHIGASSVLFKRR